MTRTNTPKRLLNSEAGDVVPSLLTRYEVVFTPEQLKGIDIKDSIHLRADQIRAIHQAHGRLPKPVRRKGGGVITGNATGSTSGQTSPSRASFIDPVSTWRSAPAPTPYPAIDPKQEYLGPNPSPTPILMGNVDLVGAAPGSTHGGQNFGVQGAPAGTGQWGGGTGGAGGSSYISQGGTASSGAILGPAGATPDDTSGGGSMLHMVMRGKGGEVDPDAPMPEDLVEMNPHRDVKAKSTVLSVEPTLAKDLIQFYGNGGLVKPYREGGMVDDEDEALVLKLA
jgi:hypothetical protein